MKPFCPECQCELHFSSAECRCDNHHRFPVRQGVPFLLAPTEGWDTARTTQEFEALYQREAEPWNYTGSGAERLKYAFLVAQAARWCGPDGGRIADVGCSLGGAAWALAQKGFDVLGMDLSSTAIFRARAARAGTGLPGRAEFIVASATRLPLATASCDVVLLSDGLRSWRLDERQIRDCLAETRRSLRPGGVAIFQDYMHPRHFDGFIGKIAASGLRVQEVHYLGDRLFYKLEGWAQKAHLRRAMRRFFASERVARILRSLSRLIGRRGTKHICVIARRE